MVSEEKRQEILERLKNGVVSFEEEAVKQAAQEVLDLGMDAYDAVIHGLSAGMERVGELWDCGEYFVPEVLMSSDALYAGLEILKPHVKLGGAGQERKNCHIVIGTVQGDVHDIGKNLVKMMFEVAGFTVHDLGRDVPLEKFLDEQIKTGAELVCLSTMMTTTMMGMKKIIEMIRAKNPNVKIMIGGAPVTPETVKQFGADGTAENASNALREAIKMVTALKNL